MTYPGASLLSFDGGGIKPTQIQDTSHFQITKGLLDHPERYWKHLLSDDEAG
jgi:predicted ATPase